MSISQLGDYLVTKGRLSAEDRDTIIRECGRQSQAFAKSIVALGIVDQDELAELLLEKHGILAVPQTELENPDPDALTMLDLPILKILEVLPYKYENQVLYVAMADPMDIDTVEQVKFITNCKVQPAVTTFNLLEESIKELDEEFTPTESPLQKFIERFGRSVQGASAIPAVGMSPQISMEFEDEESESQGSSTFNEDDTMEEDLSFSSPSENSSNDLDFDGEEADLDDLAAMHSEVLEDGDSSQEIGDLEPGGMIDFGDDLSSDAGSEPIAAEGGEDLEIDFEVEDAEGEAEPSTEALVSEESEDTGDLGDLDGADDLGDLDGADDLGDLDGADDLGDLDGADDLGDLDGADDLGDLEGADDLGDLDGADDLGGLEGADDLGDLDSTDDLGDLEGADDLGDLDSTDDLGDLDSTDDLGDLDSTDDLGDLDGADDLGDLDGADDLGDLESSIEGDSERNTESLETLSEEDSEGEISADDIDFGEDALEMSSEDGINENISDENSLNESADEAPSSDLDISISEDNDIDMNQDIEISMDNEELGEGIEEINSGVIDDHADESVDLSGEEDLSENLELDSDISLGEVEDLSEDETNLGDGEVGGFSSSETMINSDELSLEGDIDLSAEGDNGIADIALSDDLLDDSELVDISLDDSESLSLEENEANEEISLSDANIDDVKLDAKSIDNSDLPEMQLDNSIELEIDDSTEDTELNDISIDGTDLTEIETASNESENGESRLVDSEELEFTDSDIAPALDYPNSDEDIAVSDAIERQFSTEEQSKRDTSKIEEVSSENSAPPKKDLASGFINHAITRIQMSSDYKDAIRHASEGLIKSGSQFGLFIKEDNTIEPISMWQSTTEIQKPSEDDLENFKIEIGATKDNITSNWSEFKLHIDAYSHLNSLVCSASSGTARLYVIAYFEDSELESYILKGTENIIKSLDNKF